MRSTEFRPRCRSRANTIAAECHKCSMNHAATTPICPRTFSPGLPSSSVSAKWAAVPTRRRPPKRASDLPCPLHVAFHAVAVIAPEPAGSGFLDPIFLSSDSPALRCGHRNSSLLGSSFHVSERLCRVSDRAVQPKRILPAQVFCQEIGHERVRLLGFGEFGIIPEGVREGLKHDQLRV